MFFSNKIFDGSDDNSDDDSEMTMTMILTLQKTSITTSTCKNDKSKFTTILKIQILHS